MPIRFQKKSVYLLAFVASTSAFVAVFIFLYPSGMLNQPMEWYVPGLLEDEHSGEWPWEAQSSKSAAEARGVNQKAGAGAMMGQQSTEARAHTPEEIGRYVARMGSRYSSAQKFLSQADVPALLALLEDPGQSKKWWDIERLLGYIDKEEESVDGLIAFIQRGEDWRNHSAPVRIMFTKADAISTLGFVGGKSATDTLKLLFAEKGADQFLSEWVNDEVQDFVISRELIRGRAAVGLVFTQDASNIRLVEELYQSLFPQIRAIEQRPGAVSYLRKHETDEEFHQCRLYSQAVSALATRDAIESQGLEKYKSIMYDPEMRSNAVSRHLGKYGKLLRE